MRLPKLFMIILCALMPSAVSAAPAEYVCSEVSRSAVIQYDDVLILSVLKDGEGKICTFRVSLPPRSDQASSDTSDNAVNAWVKLDQIKGESKVGSDAYYVALTRDFAPVLLSALGDPLGRIEYPTEEKKLLETWLGSPEGRESVGKCASEIDVPDIKFAIKGDGISCGRVGDDAFGIQASFRRLAVYLQIPLR